MEGECQIFSAQAMINRGLYILRYEFEEYSHWDISQNPPWAKPVVNLRKVLYQIERSRNSDEKIRIAADIALLFGPRWTLQLISERCFLCRKILLLYRHSESMYSQVRLLWVHFQLMIPALPRVSSRRVQLYSSSCNCLRC